MNKLRTGDEVIVISGKDKGKTGTLTKIKGDRCLVSGIKLVKKHVKPNPQINEPGGVIEKESFINISNIAFYNSSTKKRDKLQINSDEKKGKIRVSKSTNKEVK